MNLIDIRKLSTNQLTSESTKLREEIVEIRRRVHMGETTNVRQLRNKRKELARMLTVLSEQFAKESV